LTNKEAINIKEIPEYISSTTEFSVIKDQNNSILVLETSAMANSEEEGMRLDNVKLISSIFVNVKSGKIKLNI
jgi:hypothetical protein